MNTQKDYNTILAGLTDKTVEETRTKLLDMITDDLQAANQLATDNETYKTENDRLKQENYQLFLKVTNPVQEKDEPEPIKDKEKYIMDLIKKGEL